MPPPTGGGGAPSGGGGNGGGGGASGAVVPPRVLNDLAYDIMFRVAASQLSCGLSVIVDCPLARRELFERAAALAAAATGAGPGRRPAADADANANAAGADAMYAAGAAKAPVAVVVVECVPASEEAWREAVDTRAANDALADSGGARHKPRSWDALQQLVRAYGGEAEWTRPAAAASAASAGAAASVSAAAAPAPGGAPPPRAPALAPLVPHYLSVRTLRRGGGSGGAGGAAAPAEAAAAAAAAAADADAATIAAAGEVVSWLRKRGLCGAPAGAGAGAAPEGETEAVELPVQGAHMPVIAE